MKYRKEVDGLRALAVLPVVLNHARVPPFTGGFIGVDIFFVISGFLISTIITQQISDGEFSIIDFYERRARRIIPALFVVVVTSFILAYFTMLPDDFENFSQSVVATMFFANNILLTLTSGYWELASEFKPLLHTWSLAVEEQFYIFYPLIMIAVFKLRRSALPAILIVGIVGSFAMSAMLTSTHPNSSFYMIHTRAWELLLGALASYYMKRQSLTPDTCNQLSLMGLLLIALAIFGYSESTPYPSFYAAVPCIGTALILMFANPSTITNRILSNRVLVGIGLISYSLYLWHQPVFAFARILSITPPSRGLMTTLCILTVSISYLSWRFIEQPFRNRSLLTQRQVLLSSALSSIGLGAIGFCVFRWGGLPERTPGIGLGNGHYIAFNERAFSYKKDSFSDPNRVHLLVLGNSTGRDLVNVIVESKRFSNFELIYRDDVTVCGNNIQRQPHAELFENADAIVAAANFKYDGECPYILYQSQPLSEKPFLLVGPKHFGYNLNAYMHVSPEMRPEVRAVQIPATYLASEKYRSMVSATHYVDLLRMMQDRYDGVPIFDQKGRILSADRVHLTKAGADFFANFVFSNPAWKQVFDLRPKKIIRNK